MQTRRCTAPVLAVCLALLTACAAPAPSPKLTSANPASGPSRAAGRSAGTPAVQSASALNHLPLYFVANSGQTDPQVAFYVPGKDNTIYFSPDGLTFAFTSAPASSSAGPGLGAQPASRPLPMPRVQKPAPQLVQRWAVKLDFVGANPTVQPKGENRTAAVFSYFKGRPDQWQAGVASYAQLRYHDLWPGIDLVYSGQGNQLKYEFVVQPGADPAQIQLAYRGAASVRLAPDGQLQVTTPVTSFSDAAPLAYQVKDGQRVPVQMDYRLAPIVTEGAAGSYQYGFNLGAYVPSLPLVLDPGVLVYSGYIGGADFDVGAAIAVDSFGSAYVAGYTKSNQTTFPIKAGPDLTYSGNWDAFVAKVKTDGTGLVYAGYIGGANDDFGTGIAVDGAGNAYVTGYTSSDQITFPVKVGPNLTYSGNSDTFVAKVKPDGTGLVYAGYIGGAGADHAAAIAVDRLGYAYVTGATTSDEASFPVKVGPDLTYNLGTDAFVAKVKADGTGLAYAGYIGGQNADEGNGIAVDGSGNAYVTGDTDSSQASFPVQVGPDLTFNGELYNDAFVAKVKGDGTGLVYAGYIGGVGNDVGTGIAVDSSGSAYVTGYTNSDQATFPVKVGPDLTYNGTGSLYGDAFVAKVKADGTGLVYAGYIGGSGDDVGFGVAVDSGGDAYITGYTDSSQTTFPAKLGPALTFNGVEDAFAAEVKADGTGLVYAGYIGGAHWDEAYGIAVDGSGNAYVTGFAYSDQTTFPVTVGPDLTYNGGVSDAFVAKVTGLVTFVPSAFIYLPLVRK